VKRAGSCKLINGCNSESGTLPILALGAVSMSLVQHCDQRSAEWNERSDSRQETAFETTTHDNDDDDE
jgi:hypothetical protein